MFRRAWTHPKAHWVSLVVAAIGLGAVGVWVDLSPKVESDFFFSADDPQLQVSTELNQRDGGGGEGCTWRRLAAKGRFTRRASPQRLAGLAAATAGTSGKCTSPGRAGSRRQS